MEQDRLTQDKSRFVCGICHYVYDEDKEEDRWGSLPEDWLCPLCAAPKSMFSEVKKRKRKKR